MGKNIVLIGFMGTGKSSIGFRLAQRLRITFIDMDKEIEKITGMTVAEIFKRHGEVRFRSEEILLARKLSQSRDLVIATGGGVVLQEENITNLRQNGLVICLDAEPQDILRRVKRKAGLRPLLRKKNRVEDIEQMLAEREKYYTCADYRFNTSDKGLDDVVQEILRVVQDKI